MAKALVNKLQERLVKLNLQKEQFIANVNAIAGQIQLIEELIKEHNEEAEKVQPSK